MRTTRWALRRRAGPKDSGRHSRTPKRSARPQGSIPAVDPAEVWRRSHDGRFSPSGRRKPMGKGNSRRAPRRGSPVRGRAPARRAGPAAAAGRCPRRTKRPGGWRAAPWPPPRRPGPPVGDGSSRLAVRPGDDDAVSAARGGWRTTRRPPDVRIRPRAPSAPFGGGPTRPRSSRARGLGEALEKQPRPVRSPFEQAARRR